MDFISKANKIQERSFPLLTFGAILTAISAMPTLSSAGKAKNHVVENKNIAILFLIIADFTAYVCAKPHKNKKF